MGHSTTPLWVKYEPKEGNFQRAVFEKIAILMFAKVEF